MYVSLETIITAGKVLTALGSILVIIWNLFRWVNHQKEQDDEIREIKAQHTKDVKQIREEHRAALKRLEEKHDKDVHDMKESTRHSVAGFQEELTLITYGLLACLQGLNEQGCDGPVSAAIDKINKYLNNKAHDQL